MNKYDGDFWDKNIEKYFNEMKNPYKYHVPNDEDMVNKPKHYTQGRYEAIDVIEDAITGAPTVTAGFLLGQVLKYCLRLWHKGKSLEDAKKARWYLNRLIDTLEDVTE